MCQRRLNWHIPKFLSPSNLVDSVDYKPIISKNISNKNYFVSVLLTFSLLSSESHNFLMQGKLFLERERGERKRDRYKSPVSKVFHTIATEWEKSSLSNQVQNPPFLHFFSFILILWNMQKNQKIEFKLSFVMLSEHLQVLCKNVQVCWATNSLK